MNSEKPDKVVTISWSDQGLPVPDQDPVVVTKDNQKIRWSADFDFRITVDGYDELKYSNGGNAWLCTSGCFREIKKYKYSITAKGVTNDPEIDIKP
jgi:hypothetical protein